MSKIEFTRILPWRAIALLRTCSGYAKRSRKCQEKVHLYEDIFYYQGEFFSFLLDILYYPIDSFYYKLCNMYYKLSNTCYKLCNKRYKLCNKLFLRR